VVDCERLCVGIYIQGSFHSYLNIRVTELPPQPVDFTVLKPRTRDFLSHLFHQVFANSQVSTPILSGSGELTRTRNKLPLEEIFIKATRSQALTMGLVYFLTEMKKASGEEFIQWASTVAIDTLRTGVDVIPTL
jgi:nucleolar MIF4G domain-containing protein 1